jgi:predicted transcriptional regulator
MKAAYLSGIMAVRKREHQRDMAKDLLEEVEKYLTRSDDVLANARRVGRDVKAVHGDVTALLNAGVLGRTEDGQIIFPFEAVKVEFLLQAA